MTLDKLLKWSRNMSLVGALALTGCSFPYHEQIEIKGLGKVDLEYLHLINIKTLRDEDITATLENGTKVKYMRQNKDGDNTYTTGELEEGDLVKVTKPGQKPITFVAPNVPETYKNIFQIADWRGFEP